MLSNVKVMLGKSYLLLQLVSTCIPHRIGSIKIEGPIMRDVPESIIALYPEVAIVKLLPFLSYVRFMERYFFSMIE